MAVTISGTNGIAVPLGSASAPSESNTTSATTGAYYPTGTTYALSTNGTNALYIDTSQNVGIGTSSPSGKLDVQGTGGAQYFNFSAPDAGAASVISLLGGTSSDQAICYNGLSLRFGTATGKNGAGFAERMRIDSSGNVGIGTSAPKTKLQSTAATTLNAPSLGSATSAPFYVTNSDPAYGLLVGTTASDGHVWLQAQRTDGTATAYNITLNEAGGNVGIGTSSPTSKLTVAGNTSIQDGAGYGWGGLTTYVGGSSASSFINFITASTERMRIDSSGNLLVNGTSALITSPSVNLFNGNQAQLAFRNTSATAGHYWQMGHNNDSFILYNAANAGVYITYGGTSWTSSSDERLKTDLIPIENATSKVSSLRAVTGRFKTDEEGTSRAFLIAQDVQAVLPEAVDASDPDKLGVQYTDVIPLLVAAIKELSAEVEALKAKVGA